MTRADELQKKYPGMHKEVIMKWEMMTNGVRDTKDLSKVSFWRHAAHGSYLSYDEEPLTGRAQPIFAQPTHILAASP